MITHGGIAPPQQLCTTLRRCIEPSWSPTESNCCTTISSISKQDYRTCPAFSATSEEKGKVKEKKLRFFAQGERIKPYAMVQVTGYDPAASCSQSTWSLILGGMDSISFAVFMLISSFLFACVCYRVYYACSGCGYVCLGTTSRPTWAPQFVAPIFTRAPLQSVILNHTKIS